MMSNTSGQNIESVADRIKTIEEIEKKITLAIGSAGSYSCYTFFGILVFSLGANNVYTEEAWQI